MIEWNDQESNASSEHSTYPDFSSDNDSVDTTRGNGKKSFFNSTDEYLQNNFPAFKYLNKYIDEKYRRHRILIIIPSIVFLVPITIIEACFEMYSKKPLHQIALRSIKNIIQSAFLGPIYLIYSFIFPPEYDEQKLYLDNQSDSEEDYDDTIYDDTSEIIKRFYAFDNLQKYFRKLPKFILLPMSIILSPILIAKKIFEDAKIQDGISSKLLTILKFIPELIRSLLIGVIFGIYLTAQSIKKLYKNIQNRIRLFYIALIVEIILLTSVVTNGFFEFANTYSLNVAIISWTILTITSLFSKESSTADKSQLQIFDKILFAILSIVSPIVALYISPINLSLILLLGCTPTIFMIPVSSKAIYHSSTDQGVRNPTKDFLIQNFCLPLKL